MAVKSLGDALMVIMRRHGWTGTRLAREIGTSQPWVSMVLSGKRDPGMARSAALLRRVGWELELVPSKEDDPVKRRRFLASATSVAFMPQLTPSAKPYRDADYVRVLADRLAHTEEQIGGAPLVREAVRHVHHVASAIEGGERRLQGAAARLARQAALVLHDTRRLGQAEKAAVLSLALAGKAGDAQAQALAYDTLALIRTYGSAAASAVECARRGLALGGLDDATRAMLLVRLGRSLAVLPGQERQVRRAVDRAQELMDRLGALDSAEIMANAGIALSDCGLPARGAIDLRSAVAAVESQSPLLLALYQARLAKTAVRARDIDETARAMTALSRTVPLVTSRRVDIHVRHLLDGTRGWSTILEVKDARERLAEVSGWPTGRAWRTS
ncbi:helix-turn-helix domain-containing protein [Thermomonospora cellulosilytica]|uniref:Transcriptional regulator with XRE-family HTH domain n=1 Tax=Thermomonospora cellulosilytica TaxID=1411118 RepID=A0A7W3MV87_9ACTN|nr:helix-turn-helix transcriptional regulator [Thermomonospora cellulosilytica]MBA9002452.1 transcriptional regulator with XRE-family HTH domain [Thermomonospora cellulosilytica]